MDPLLLLLRDELSRRLSDVAATMAATVEVLGAARTVAGDSPGTEAMRAAIDDLTRAHEQLLGQARTISASTPAGR